MKATLNTKNTTVEIGDLPWVVRRTIKLLLGIANVFNNLAVWIMDLPREQQ